MSRRKCMPMTIDEMCRSKVMSMWLTILKNKIACSVVYNRFNNPIEGIPYISTTRLGYIIEDLDKQAAFYFCDMEKMVTETRRIKDPCGVF